MTAVPKKRKNEPGSDKAAEDERGKGYTLRKWLKKEEERCFCYIMVLYWICGMCAAALLKCREKCEIRSRLCPPFLALRSIHFETILIILPVLNQRLRATPRQENANEVGFEETDDVTGIR